MRYAFPRPKTALLAAFLLLLIAPWASAAPRHGSPQPARISGGIAIPDVLSLAWSFISGGWMKEGCNIDPNGNCLPALPVKTGCHIDPSGRCLSDPTATIPLSSADTGCQIDPSGRCRP
jgi:hypothetical protein